MNEIYAKYQTTLELINALAPEIATTINTINDKFNALKTMATQMANKLAAGTKFDKNEVENLKPRLRIGLCNERKLYKIAMRLGIFHPQM